MSSASTPPSGVVSVDGAQVRFPGRVRAFAFVTVPGELDEVRVRHRTDSHHGTQWVCDECGPQLVAECWHAAAMLTALERADESP